MPTLQIRDLPEDVYQGVSIAARTEQRSLSQQAVVELRRALNLGGDAHRGGVLQMLMASERRLPASAASPEALQREDREG